VGALATASLHLGDNRDISDTSTGLPEPVAVPLDAPTEGHRHPVEGCFQLLMPVDTEHDGGGHGASHEDEPPDHASALSWPGSTATDLSAKVLVWVCGDDELAGEDGVMPPRRRCVKAHTPGRLAV